MKNSAIRRYEDSGTEPRSINLQAWVPVREVASILREMQDRGSSIKTLSDLMRYMLHELYEQVNWPFTSSEEAVRWMETNGFSTKQVRGVSKKKYGMSLVLEERRAKQGEQIEENTDYAEIVKALLSDPTSVKISQKDEKGE